MKNSPFTLIYGIASKSIVSRDDDMKKIIDSFVEQENNHAKSKIFRFCIAAF